MNKKIILTLSLLLAFGSSSVYAANPFNYDLQKDMNRSRDKAIAERKQAKEDAAKKIEDAKTQQQIKERPASFGSTKLDTSDRYYPNANLNSAIKKYKIGNNTGCLQELFSFVKKDPSNPVAYYYMAMAYSQIGDTTAAIGAYEKVVSLSSNDVLTSYAVRGKACLSGDTALCHPDEAVAQTGQTEKIDPLDKFIASPYGNGFSEELNEQMKQQELQRIQKGINNNGVLEKGEFRRLKDLENNETQNNFKSENPSKEDIIAALDILKAAGLTLSIQQPETEEQKNMKLAAQMMNSPQSQQFNEMSMLLGNNNNNNNMMNMLPMMLAQNGGKNIDPQVMQAMMMQSMMPDINFNMNNNNY